MERIKTAVERARQERDQVAGTAKPAARPAAQVGKIEYTDTRTVDVSPDVLMRNRILSGAEPQAFQDAFKILRTQTLQRLDENNWNALAITSTKEDEGKTVTAINLALSLAMEVQRTVLLVDANLRNPGVHKCFGMADGPGLSDYLSGEGDLSDLLVNPGGIDRFVILPGGSPVANSSEMLSSPRMGTLVEELKQRYPERIVVFDLPPVLSASDAMAFSPFVDAALLVIGEGDAAAPDIQQAARMLESTNLIGTVLNRAWGT